MTDYDPRLLDAICRKDLLAFSQKAFAVVNPGTDLQTSWHHEAITLKLEEVQQRRAKRVIINGPPRCLKSYLTSIALPAFALGQDPTRKMICGSYSQDLSGKLSNDCRRLMESDYYKRLFPHVRLIKSTEFELETEQGGSRYATSPDSTLTGRGADDIIIDDPLNANEAYSEKSRQKMQNWFSRSVVSRLDRKSDGTIIVVAQRLHVDDITGYLLLQKGWEHLCFPATALRDTSFQLRGHVHHWREGEPLQPLREPIPVLELMRTELGSPSYAAQYEQQPAPERGNLLKHEWLRCYDSIPTRQPGDMMVQSWDTAFKANESSDYSACLTFLVRNKNQYYLIDAFRDKLEFPQLMEEIRQRSKKFAVDCVLIEDKASGTSATQQLRQYGVQGIVSINPIHDKQTRMYNRTPDLEAGSLLIPNSAPWRGHFVQEYLEFPMGKYDDQIDALSQFLTWQFGRRSNLFDFDFGNESEGALSPDHMLRYLGRW